jgi:hypothetical protein
MLYIVLMLLHTVETTFIYTILSCLSFLLKWEERISLALLWSAISIECLLYKSSVMTKGAASLNYEAMLICQFFSSKRIVNFPIEPLTKFSAQYLYHDFSFEFDQLRCNEGNSWSLGLVIGFLSHGSLVAVHSLLLDGILCCNITIISWMDFSTTSTKSYLADHASSKCNSSRFLIL